MILNVKEGFLAIFLIFFKKIIFPKIYYELYLSFHLTSQQQSVVFDIDSV